ncbi:cupin domain-containing protein [Chamaesiphon sp. VAR_48_metabat_135_sub]|uniref:cupin domain-containing protein n=1 Tax=Chamaesiphon sp. VAR_48_metabat_135_sub TaxID=2964699 RepID=UPI00286A2862|nr:cupin domain-containing protein [Chamaesiphon sp. VAR_48_metabat_135_sub]
MMKDDHRCFCELAPLYALNLLDLEERLWVEAQVLECPDLAEELAGYQTAVGTIPYGAEPMPMATDLKDRLFDRLGLDPVESVPENPPALTPALKMFAIKAENMQWKPHRMEGVEVVVLFIDEINRMRNLLVKAAAGVTYPLHQHHGIEEIYMLEGELVLDGEVYLAGDYIRSYPNSIHAPSTSTGCMFLIRACIDDNYDENLVIRSI